ncbi:hypothetical protein HN289_20930, partial [Acinetobacter baumannii]|nr:hypothetical protein [Acinetobacter baumannii]
MTREFNYLTGIDADFNRVSPKYGRKETIASLTILAPMIIVALVFAIIFTSEVPWLHAIWVVLLAFTVFLIVIIIR